MSSYCLHVHNASAFPSSSTTWLHASFWPIAGCVPVDKGRKLHWNEPENMLKHPYTKPAICNLLLGVVRRCSVSLFFIPFFLSPPPRLPCAVFATPRRVNSNVCHSWLCFTWVVFFFRSRSEGVVWIAVMFRKNCRKMFTSGVLLPSTATVNCGRGGGFFKDTQSNIRIHAWWSNVNDYP